MDDLAALARLERLDGVAHQVEDDRLDLDLVDEHRRDVAVERKARPDRVLLRADEGERSRLLDDLVQLLDALLGLAGGDEGTQAADHLAGARRLRHRLLDHRIELVGDRAALRVRQHAPRTWR